MIHSRRQLLQTSSVAAPALSRAAASNTIEMDPKPRFEISPHLYMQFIEPLGAPDASVQAA